MEYVSDACRQIPAKHRHSDDTTEVDDRYLEIITIHGREYQNHSIENNIHLVPVDEVCLQSSIWRTTAQMLPRKKEAG